MKSVKFNKKLGILVRVDNNCDYENYTCDICGDYENCTCDICGDYENCTCDICGDVDDGDEDSNLGELENLIWKGDI